VAARRLTATTAVHTRSCSRPLDVPRLPRRVQLAHDKGPRRARVSREEQPAAAIIRQAGIFRRGQRADDVGARRCGEELAVVHVRRGTEHSGRVGSEDRRAQTSRAGKGATAAGPGKAASNLLRAPRQLSTSRARSPARQRVPLRPYTKRCRSMRSRAAASRAPDRRRNHPVGCAIDDNAASSSRTKQRSARCRRFCRTAPRPYRP